jgi:hypothetical protein
MTGKREKAARKCRECIEKHPDEEKTFRELLTEIIKGLSAG